MSFLQAFNYSFAPFAASPFGPAAGATNRFAPYSSPGNQLLSQTPQEIAASFPLPQSISSSSDYYGNPSIQDQVVSSAQSQQQQQQEQIHNQPQQQIQSQIYSSHNLPGAPEIITQQQHPYQNIPHHQQQQLVQQPQRELQHHQQQQQQQQELEQTSHLQLQQQHLQQPQPQQQQHLQQQQQHPRKRRPKNNNSRTRSVGLGNPNDIRVTPIQGPIFAKDGYVPVVPLYSYPAVNNGTLYQIPILWTALSFALGLEIRGEILRGLPCIKRLNQLFCPTAGTTYPLDRIERFIDENKALIKRMYGEFSMNPESYIGPVGGNTLRRNAREVYEDEVPNLFAHPDVQKHNMHRRNAGSFDNSTDSHVRTSRQTVNPRNGGPTQQPKSNKVDSCESTVEIVTPYWAANSSGKVRAIVNTQHFEQAIHQEVCAKTTTKRCTGDCACEQKYKWHRLLAYEPDNDCRGIFMDWFLFPSCCVCRCNPTS